MCLQARFVDVFWSGFLHLTVKVRCGCPTCSYSLFLFYLFYLFLPVIKLGFARPGLFLAIMTLCRSIIEKMKLLQSKGQ